MGDLYIKESYNPPRKIRCVNADGVYELEVGRIYTTNALIARRSTGREFYQLPENSTWGTERFVVEP